MESASPIRRCVNCYQPITEYSDEWGVRLSSASWQHVNTGASRCERSDLERAVGLRLLVTEELSADD